MKLSIIIPTCDRGVVFDGTLRWAMEAIHGLDAEIIVVNDSPRSMPTIPEDAKRVTLLRNPGKGVGAARNFGARNATGHLLLFLDDDVLVTNQTLLAVMEVHRQHAGIALNPDWIYPPDLVSKLNGSSFGRFLEAHQMTTFRGWYADASWKDQALFESLSVASFHLSITPEDFQRSGGYDEQFPFAGFEDYDFPLRLKKAGIRFRIDTRILVFHNEADRVLLDGWLGGQERRAFTRAVAVHKGYQQLTLDYPLLKRWLLSCAQAVYPFLLWNAKRIPNRKSFDAFAFKWFGYLQAVRIYQGYSRGLKK